MAVGGLALLLAMAAPVAAAPLKTTVYVEGTSAKAAAEAVTEGLEAAVEGRKDLAFTTLGELIAEPTSAAEKTLANIAAEISAGEKLTDNLEIEKAMQRLQAAAALQVDHYHLWHGKKAARDSYRRTLGSLAIAQFLAGKKEECRKTLLHAFIGTRRPSTGRVTVCIRQGPAPRSWR